jgi:WD40 repeat protein
MRPISMVPIELLEARDRGELILCVGPELGRSAGLPSSAQLAVELLADAQRSDLDLDPQVLGEWIAKGRIGESLEILERRLGARFHRVVEQSLADRGRPVPALARAVAGLRDKLRAVYTTGIDRLLERAFADEWPSFSSPRHDVARRSKLIFKLCGTLEFPETWVLTRAGLDREFGERSLRRELLSAACRAHCLLFVGFDPSDELAIRLLSILEVGEGGEQLPSHFIVVERATLEQRALLERRGLHVIVGEPVALLEVIDREARSQVESPIAELPTCPYPGLQPFDGSLAAVFHGRRAEISQAAARLGGPETRQRRWLAIDGSSGVGKSSFVHAGLVPALSNGFAEGTPTRWRIAGLRPGRRPFRTLVEALASTLDHPQLAEGSPATIDEVERVAEFVRARATVGVGLLVIVDQLEELVTLGSADENACFAACLALLLEQRQVYLITTMRSDFIAALSSATPVLARLLNDQAERYTLAPISRVGLRVAIAEPAAQLGVLFEDELVERIASDAEHHLRSGGDEAGVTVRTDDAALPLVAHVLRGLWDSRAGEDGLITFAEYRALGGVSGALSRSADAVLAQLGPDPRARAKTLLLRMVDLDDGRLARRTLTRAEALSLLGDQGERLLELLSGGAGPRLLVVRSEEHEVLVDLVHEALLREWDTLRGWIAADQAQLARDEALARRAAAWVAHGRPRSSLPRGPERRELLRGRPHGRDTDKQRAYQRAMSRAAWLRGGSWIGFVALLGVTGVLVVEVIEREKAVSEQREAELLEEVEEKDEQLALTTEDRDRIELQQAIGSKMEGGHCRDALRDILNALPHDESLELRAILATAVRCEAVVGEVGRVVGRGHAVTGLGVDAEGSEAWVGWKDGAVERWSLRDHGLIAAERITNSVDSIQFSPHGDRVALGSEGNGSTALRDGQGNATGKVMQGSNPVFLHSGRQIATWGNSQLDVYDSASGDRIHTQPIEGNIEALQSLANSNTMFVASGARAGSRVLRVSLDDLPPVDDLLIDNYLRDVALSRDGLYLASTADDNSVRLWDVGSGLELTDPLYVDVQAKKRKFVRFSPDSSMLAIRSKDDVVVVTDIDLNVLGTHEGVNPALAPRFFPGGRWLLIADSSPSVSLRDAGSKTGEAVARVDFEGAINVLAASPQGDAIVGGFADGSLIHWAVDTRDRWRDSKPHNRAVKALRFSRENPRQLASASSGHVQTWSIGDTDAGDWTTSLSAPKCAAKDVTMSITSERLAMMCSSGEVLWERSQRILAEPTKLELSSIAISAKGDQLALGGSDGKLELWQFTADNVEIRPIVAGHAGPVTSLAFAPDGERLVSGGNDDLVKLWTLADLEHPLEWSMGATNVETVAITSGRGRFAAGDDKNGMIKVWDFDGKMLYEFEGGCTGSVTALEFSPDGELLAAGCSNGEVLAWPIGEAAQVELACQRLARTSSDPSLPTICSEPSSH